MQDALVIQRPEASVTPPAELLLLFHGVGSSAEDLRQLGEALAGQRPGAWVVSVRSPERSEFGAGWQWFSVQGVIEASRPARVAAAMPAFLQTVEAWQRDTGVPAAHTTLIGFSQGAIMALESTQQGEATAGRVVAIAGRFWGTASMRASSRTSCGGWASSFLKDDDGCAVRDTPAP
jgi:phospholipase/carboxylesterase